MIPHRLTKHHQGVCPYVAGFYWTSESFFDCFLSSQSYQTAIEQGFRRSGFSYYRNACINCQACIPLRVKVQSFTPSRSQRRAWSKNQHLTIELAELKAANDEIYLLYCKYLTARQELASLTKRDFEQIFLAGPNYTRMVKCFLNGQLIAVSWIDILPQSISSVYAIYDPDYKRRSLGIYSALVELEIAKQMGLEWYYLGYWVQQSSKMNYKSKFRPYELLQNGRWQSPTASRPDC